MRFSSFTYLAKQGLMPSKGNRFMSFASIIVLASSLVITGIAVLISANINSFVDMMGDENEIVVYLQEGLSDEQVTQFGASLSQLPNVDYANTVFISKEDALEDQINYVGEYGYILEGYRGDENPFPASYRVKIFELESLADTTEKISQLPGIDYISSPTDIASALVSLETTVMIAGWGLVVVLACVSLVVIANTIRLTVFARRKEINIMKYVGATNSFIRFPFFIEGVVIGLLAAAISFGLISGAYLLLLDNLGNSALSFLALMAPSIVPYEQIALYLGAGFLAGGVFVGVIGSQISINRYLKV